MIELTKIILDLIIGLPFAVTTACIRIIWEAIKAGWEAGSDTFWSGK